MTEQTSEHDRRIVVGIDGSLGSQAALGWAVTQARLTGAAVEGIAAWQEPLVLNHGYPMGYLGEESLSTLTRKLLDDVVAAVTAEQGEATNVLTRTVMGHPAQVLPEAAAGAQLLVVGSRGLAPSPGCCSDRSASTASNTRPARSSSSLNKGDHARPRQP